MARIRHTGPVGSILTAKMGHNGGPAWDPTGQEPAYNEKYFSASWDGAQGVVVSADGTRVFMTAVVSGTGYLRQYNLAVPFDVSSIAGNTAASSLNLGSGLSYGLDVSPDGTKFIIRYSTGSVNVVTCPTPWSLAGASVGSGWIHSAYTHSFYRYQWMSADGLSLYQLGHSTSLYKFSLAVPWTPVAAGTTVTQLTEASFFGSLSPLTSAYGGSYWYGGRFSADGRRFFGYTAAGNIGFPIYWSIDLETPNDLFGTRTFRGRRPILSLTGNPVYASLAFCLGEEGKSIFWLLSSGSGGLLHRMKFAP